MWLEVHSKLFLSMGCVYLHSVIASLGDKNERKYQKDNFRKMQTSKLLNFSNGLVVDQEPVNMKRLEP